MKDIIEVQKIDLKINFFDTETGEVIRGMVYQKTVNSDMKTLDLVIRNWVKEILRITFSSVYKRDNIGFVFQKKYRSENAIVFTPDSDVFDPDSELPF